MSTSSAKNSGKKTEMSFKEMLSNNSSGPTPLENRYVEVKDPGNSSKSIPAFSARHAQKTAFMTFYMPILEGKDDNEILQWKELMEFYLEDILWMLNAPYHVFWSVLVHAPQFREESLKYFLMRAPRCFDSNFDQILRHEVVGPLYKKIYVSVFKIFLRICTYKESKVDFMSPEYWSSLLAQHQIFDVPQLLDLCALYESKDNVLLPKMVENVVSHQPQLLKNMKAIAPVFSKKLEVLMEELSAKFAEDLFRQQWDLESYRDILSFEMDATFSFYKGVKAYPESAKIFHEHNFLLGVAAFYEMNFKIWGSILEKIPSLLSEVETFRKCTLHFFRFVLVEPTIMKAESSNDHKVDQFFDALTSCLDEKIFIHDYEMLFPFRSDMQNLLIQGIFVDETRIDYMANAISSCFQACGEQYSVEKIVVDPLYDSNFDRQLLGACSLDISKTEMQSLVTQVKDLLPELPESYVEAVLKHYSYNTETSINAILEGSVPSRLDKYKSEDYMKLQSSSNVSSSHSLSGSGAADFLAHPLPKLVTTEEPSSGKQEIVELDDGSRKLKSKYEDESKFLDEKEPGLKDAVLASVEKMCTPSFSTAMLESGEIKDSPYIAENLLPEFDTCIEYDDEYDDTYDEAGIGMTEPDNIRVKPLNAIQKTSDARDYYEEEEDDEEEKNRDEFVQNPEVVRAQVQRRWEQKNFRRGGGPSPAEFQRNRDVVGKAKGQGQEKDVLYNRRQKAQNKDQVANHRRKKMANMKRREF